MLWKSETVEIPLHVYPRALKGKFGWSGGIAIQKPVAKIQNFPHGLANSMVIFGLENSADIKPMCRKINEPGRVWGPAGCCMKTRSHVIQKQSVSADTPISLWLIKRCK